MVKAMEFEANATHLNLLSKFYKRIFHEHFLSTGESVDKLSSDLRHNDHVSNCYRFGWLLFLALRIHTFSQFMDLVTCTNGLISILAILIIHMPTSLRKFSFTDSHRFVRKGDQGVDLFASLCGMYHASEDDLRETFAKASRLIIDILGNMPQASSEHRSVNLEGINMDGLLYFNELMDASSLLPSIAILDKDYSDFIHNKGAVDEREFISDDLNLSVSRNDLKRTRDASPENTLATPLSPCRSPAQCREGSVHGSANSKMAATPVTTAMTTAKWLRTVICPLSETPSVTLQNFLSSCDKDITNDVIGRANLILEAIFSSGFQSANLTDNIWAEQRRAEALKLYYKVLEAMCTAESQILHASNLTPLLTNESFHRCMLACSAELVLAIHKTATMLFPAVLERTGVTAFDLSKVVECFIRHEESLPRELRRHLNSLEERLLESMVWGSGSSMYNSLIVAKPAFSEEINRLGLLADPIPSLDTIANQLNISLGGLAHFPSSQKQEASPGQSDNLQSPKRLCTNCRSVLVERNSFTSPVKGRLLACNNLKTKPSAPLQSVFASPTQGKPGGGGETYAQTAINSFFSKVLKLAAVRINGLVERLKLSQQIRECVYSLFQKILFDRTNLFFSRHIDQIILCCFYGVSKISQKNLTFREIIHNYRKQPQCKPQTIHGVFVNWACIHDSGRTGQGHVDIIMFYNKVFIPAVKPLLMELGAGGIASKDNHNDGDGKCPGSPSVSPFSSLPDMSPRKVSAKQNVYVSPLRSSKMDALISHGSKSYYACVGESTHAYQSPSKDLTAINDRLNGGRRVRGMLNFDDADVGLVSDCMVADSLRLSNGASGSSSAALKNLE